MLKRILLTLAAVFFGVGMFGLVSTQSVSALGWDPGPITWEPAPAPEPPPRVKPPAPANSYSGWFDTGQRQVIFSGHRITGQWQVDYRVDRNIVTWRNRPWVGDETAGPWVVPVADRLSGAVAVGEPGPTNISFSIYGGSTSITTPQASPRYTEQFARIQAPNPYPLRGGWDGICSLITEEQTGFGDFVADLNTEYNNIESLYDFAVSRAEWTERQYGITIPRDQLRAVFPDDDIWSGGSLADAPASVIIALGAQIQDFLAPYQADAMKQQSMTLNYAYGIYYNQKDRWYQASGAVDWKRQKLMQENRTEWYWDEGAWTWRPNSYSVQRWEDTGENGTLTGTSAPYVYERTLDYDWEGGQDRGATECLFPPQPYIVTQTCIASYGPVRVTGPVGVGVNPEYNKMGRNGNAYKSKSSTQTLTSGGSAWKARTSFGNWFKNTYSGLNLDNEAQNGSAMNVVRGAGCNESLNVPVPVQQTVEMYGGGKFKIVTNKDVVKCNYWFYPYYNQYRLISCAPAGVNADAEYVQRECNGSTTGISKAAFDAGRTSGQNYALSKCYNQQCIWSRDGRQLSVAERALEPQTYEDTGTGQKNLIHNAQRLYTVQADGRRIFVDYPSLRMVATSRTGSLLPTSANVTIPKFTVWSAAENSLPWSSELGLNQKPNHADQVFGGRVNNVKKLWVERRDSLGLLEEEPAHVDSSEVTPGWDDTGANILTLSFFQPSPGSSDRFTVNGYFNEVKTAPISYYSVTRVGPSGTNQGEVRELEDDLIFTCEMDQPTSFRAVGGRNTTGR